MKTMEWKTIDKSTWKRGPWDGEPDKRQWQDEDTGLPCLIVRTGLGHLCGYVGVPPGHPMHGKDYIDGSLNAVEVHGGLTFASRCRSHTTEDWESLRSAVPRLKAESEQFPVGDAAQVMCDWGPAIESYEKFVELSQARGICHRDPDGPEVWWFGFDCAHCDDLSPGIRSVFAGRAMDIGGRRGVYRDIGYVTEECRRLAAQLHAVVS